MRGRWHEKERPIAPWIMVLGRQKRFYVHLVRRRVQDGGVGAGEHHPGAHAADPLSALEDVRLLERLLQVSAGVDPHAGRRRFGGKNHRPFDSVDYRLSRHPLHVEWFAECKDTTLISRMRHMGFVAFSIVTSSSTAAVTAEPT